MRQRTAGKSPVTDEAVLKVVAASPGCTARGISVALELHCSRATDAMIRGQLESLELRGRVSRTRRYVGKPWQWSER